MERTGIPAAEKVHSVTKAQRRRLLEVLKCLRIDIQGPRPVEEAIVTSGGIKVSEINPTTLESKKAPASILPGRCWMWMPTLAASICKLPGPPATPLERPPHKT